MFRNSSISDFSYTYQRESLYVKGIPLCGKNNYGAAIFFVAMLFPVVLFHLLAIRKPHHPLAGTIVSIVQNIYFSYLFISFFCYIRHTVTSPGFSIIFAGILIPVSIITNYWFFYRRGDKKGLTSATKYRRMMFDYYYIGKHKLSQETKIQVVNTKNVAHPDTFVEDVLKEAVYGPPKIFVRNYYLLKKGCFLYVPYGSWTPLSSPTLDYKKGSIMIFKFNHQFQVDEELHNKINVYIEGLKFVQLRYYGVDFNTEYCNLKVVNQVGNLAQTMVIGNKSWFMSFLNSKFGNIIFIIAHFFGFSIIFDDIFGLLSQTTEITTNRTIAIDDSEKNRKYKADAEGGVDIDDPGKDMLHVKQIYEYFKSIGYIARRNRDRAHDSVQIHRNDEYYANQIPDSFTPNVKSCMPPKLRSTSTFDDRHAIRPPPSIPLSNRDSSSDVKNEDENNYENNVEEEPKPFTNPYDDM